MRNINYAKQDDQSLIQLTSKKNSIAFSELYDRYSTLVFSLAINIVGSHQAAEDITLDVFTKVWNKAGTYNNSKATVKRWISSITRYRSIDVLRRRKTHLNSSNPKWTDFSPESLPSKENPEEAMELALIRHEVAKALSKLPEEQKKALAMAYFMGYSHKQIAEALNEPLGTIKTRIRLAVQKLKKELNIDGSIADRSKS